MLRPYCFLSSQHLGSAGRVPSIRSPTVAPSQTPQLTRPRGSRARAQAIAPSRAIRAVVSVVVFGTEQRWDFGSKARDRRNRHVGKIESSRGAACCAPTFLLDRSP